MSKTLRPSSDDVQTMVYDVIATGVEGRDVVIRQNCEVGVEVKLRPTGLVIFVLVKVTKFLGLVTKWKVVGVVKTDPQFNLLARVRRGLVSNARVQECYAPVGKSQPLLKIAVDVPRTSESKLAPLS
ncbi:MAG: hypothetical protein EON92_05355 [Burkholderiales bacterium]|nr:MAG: hypothetical protein EON92_05355 [Burkholderiales bacterium]